MTVLIGVAGAVLGAVVGAIATYLTTRSNMLLGLLHEYDKSLRDKRLGHYQQLFHISRQIPRHWRLVSEPTRSDLLKIREEFHNWYFGPEAPGMFLTPAAKDLYLQLQNALDDAIHHDIRNGAPPHISDAPLTPEESHTLRHLTSELRHQLAEDVGASSPPRLRWTRLGTTVQPAVEAAGSSD